MSQIKTLLSLPVDMVQHFSALHIPKKERYFCTSDPEGNYLGSGAGTAWLLSRSYEQEKGVEDASEWLSREQRILIHAGGQSRRLPAYASCGKVFMPQPVLRWARGQRLSQTLLDMQLPFYENLYASMPERIHTLVASGDVYIRYEGRLPAIPSDADVVCYGIWANTAEMTSHGVFMIPRDGQGELDFMLQKPSIEEQKRYRESHYALMDIGVWFFSDRAIERLIDKSVQKGGLSAPATDYRYYDLYSEYGKALGLHPSLPDADLSDLKVVVVPLEGGEFYHFGTSKEMISSTMALQNLVKDQRFILQKGVKHHPSLFTQNSKIELPLTEDNNHIWVENARLGAHFHLSNHNIVTGVPDASLAVELSSGQCLDVVPWGDEGYVLRPYGWDDAFRGKLDHSDTFFLGMPFGEWCKERNLSLQLWCTSDDIQDVPLFPVCATIDELQSFARFMCMGEGSSEDYAASQRVSATDISAHANIERSFAQRRSLELENFVMLAKNWRNSVFYQLDLSDAAQHFASQLPLPLSLPDNAPLDLRIHDAMFRSEVLRLEGKAESEAYAKEAFSMLRMAIVEDAQKHKVRPTCQILEDQIVWARSGARIDLAGGWTDTPPYSLMQGGNVVNLSIEMNGQQPLQVYVKPCKELKVVCRSIDLGAVEEIRSYEQLRDFTCVGSPFSIPKAALALVGFLPEFGVERFTSLQQQLEAIGCGIEITLFSAIPAGSGLGTSSILSATVLGALNDFCGLGWDRKEIASRTFVLEQLLTTGGGWQDQYGGIWPGVKLLQSSAGILQNVVVRQMPEMLFTEPEYAPCHLLYYTGITRRAKNILSEIVRGMFLNDERHALLNTMREHAIEMFDSVEAVNIERYGKLLRRTWEYNKALDSGTNPPAIEQLVSKIDDLCLGYKLPGAGGGGFMYMVAKDAEAALRIRKVLQENALQPTARFVDMSVSHSGLEISRS